jgi:hypothetical protein
MPLWILIANIFGCPEPIPLQNKDQKSDSKNLTDERISTPNVDTQNIARNEKGCRVTQFWAPTMSEQKMNLISGQILYDKEATVPYLIDVISVENNAAIFGVECATQNEFSVNIPQDLGEVWLFVFADIDGNGPSKTDPQGKSDNIIIKQQSISNIKVTVQDGVIIEEGFQLAPPNGNPEEGGAPEEIPQ